MRKIHISYPVMTAYDHERMMRTSKSDYKPVYKQITGQECDSYQSCWYYDKKFYHFSGLGDKASSTSMNYTGENIAVGKDRAYITYPELTAREHEALFLASKENFAQVFKAITGQVHHAYNTPWLFCGMFFHLKSEGFIDKTTIWHDPANITKDPWPPEAEFQKPFSLAERFRKVSDHSIDVVEDNGIRTTFNFMMQHVVITTDKKDAPAVVVNFDDIQRQEAITEAYNKLKDKGGNPPDPSAIPMGKKRISGLNGLAGGLR